MGYSNVSKAEMVTSLQGMIREFQVKHGFALDLLRSKKRWGKKALRDMLRRLHHLTEELSELADAFAEDDVVEMADALGDLLYLVLGTGNTLGMDLGDVLLEVHRSNMTKVPNGSGHPRGKGYSRPRLQPIMEYQKLM